MEQTPRELTAAQHLTEALLEFGLALAEGHRERVWQREQTRQREQLRAETQPSTDSVARWGAPRSKSSQEPERLLLSTRDACRALSVSARKLFDLTAPRGPIPAVRIGTLVRYEVSDLKNAVLSMKQHQPKDPP